MIHERQSSNSASYAEFLDHFLPELYFPEFRLDDLWQKDS